MNRTFTAILCWLVPVILSAPLLAQSLPNPLPQCGTEDLTPLQKRALVQQGNLALERKRASGAAFNTIAYVPIRPHIFRRSDGTGGFTLANLNQAMAITNNYYLLNGYGIQFYFAGTTPDYIDNDRLLNNFLYDDESSVNGRDATNAMNQYYVNQIANNTVGGYAYYPENSIHSTRSFIATYDNGQMNYVTNSTIPHELGHSFNLRRLSVFNLQIGYT
ncbi:zinc-dependent metalloprotease family protein [Spirosoma agri]|uniref:Zinc-dependent metalloproteinase lipoprotein n=1 Tax=Spirosoma agri TaxID=1987381 RepID=A0A6M0ITD1_9BACT|nr:zinc-dependent metalloprotease family protein [Spirosoma agri]NEU70483.1 hypothetical protein [Spirosoma agri]